MTHVLVIANETAASSTLLDALQERAAQEEITVTVIAPVSEPKHGFVVYDDARRASAGRRLDKTLRLLRSSSVPAMGFVVETSPVQAAKDALAQLEPPPDEIVVSTFGEQRSGWMRRNVVDDIRRAAGDIPVRHVMMAEDAEAATKNVLVIANETMLSQTLRERIRERVAKGPATFLIVAPQSDAAPAPEAERRLRRALSELLQEGIDASGHVVHPDPYAAAKHAIEDERVDEIIVSTFPGRRSSSWLRGDLIERLQKDTGLPVDHVEAEAEPLEVGAE